MSKKFFIGENRKGDENLMDKFEMLSKKIKEARIENGLTQEQLAEMLNISPTHVKYIESGRRKPSIEILFALAQILSLSLDEVVFAFSRINDYLLQKVLLEANDKEKKILTEIASVLKDNRE